VLAESGPFGPAVPLLGTAFGVANGRVVTPDGGVGFVAELRPASSAEEPDVIAVHAGHLDGRILSVPLGEIEEISQRKGASSTPGHATRDDPQRARSASAAATPETSEARWRYGRSDPRHPR
jgi:hypothetical protein